ncbi:MAG: thioredoxin family protein [Bacteroidota bacterium]|nr:thioredoxin family protein [Bacteroidota bacterium]
MKRNIFLSIGILLSFFALSCKKDQTQKTIVTEITPTQPTTNSGYQIGDLATDFKLTNVDDKQVSLADFVDAKGYIVIFTCNHCPYAIAYEDRILALDAKYKPLGYPVIAINPNNPEKQPEDSFENMKIKATEKQFTFPYLFDQNQNIYPQYGATKTPHVFVLEKTPMGNKVRYIGAIDDNSEDANQVTEKYVEMAVDALLLGEEVKIPQTKSIGCSIKK